MSLNALNQLFAVLKVRANVFHNGQYCGTWSVDTSGSSLMNFHVVTRGKCEIQVEGEIFTLNEGDAIFMPMDASHKIAASIDNGATLNSSPSIPMTQLLEEESTGLVCGHFAHQHPIFNRLLAQLPSVLVVKQKKSGLASRILKLILEESNHSGLSPNYLLDRLSDSLLYVLFRDNVDFGTGVFAAMNHPKLSKSFDLIHNNTDQRLSVEQLAKQAGMSRSAFSSLFKELVDLSPAEYLTQWRMTQAYRWLVDEGISTYEAALRCGYESDASFSKAFKRIIGSGPGEVRQISKK